MSQFDMEAAITMAEDMQRRERETGERITLDQALVRYTPEFKLGTDGPRTGGGTSVELAKAATVALAIAKHYGESVCDFFVAGHEHEELSKGSVSVAWEGYVDSWAVEWPETDSARKVAQELNVWFEPVLGCILAVHPLGH